MALVGALKTFSLSTILQLLSNEKMTGILQVNNTGAEYQIFILDGYIIYAIEPLKKARLGDLLKQDGLLTENQIQECLAIAKKEKQALGKTLVKMGFISSEVLKQFLYKQVEEILFTLFLWEAGDFEFKETALNLQWLVAFKLNIMKLILDASRRVDTLSKIAKHIPDDTIVFKMSEKAKTHDRKKLNSDESNILSLIDGARTVRNIMDESGFDEFILQKILYSFIAAGLIEK